MIAPPKHRIATIDAQINIVPYIDVMLVLLVIFMMTTPIIEQGIEVDLPIAQTNPVDFSEQQPSIITINKKGEYFINSLVDDHAQLSDGEDGNQLTLSALIGQAQALLDIYPQMKFFVRGDREVAYGSVVDLMSDLQKFGVDKVGLITESPDSK